MDIWKTIIEDSDYEVNEIGEVRSKKTGRFLKRGKTKLGYLQVGLHGKSYYVHRLVAVAFIPNPEGKKCVDHINGIRDDNRASNLRWCSQWDNVNFPNSKRSKAVLQFTKEMEFVKEYPSLREAERETGINNSCISACCTGKLKTSGKYIWRHKEG